ncbi:MobF family relaxase [Hydrogenophaga sp. SL48]|uniref:MobF family relaxase n=1 Tax=Hydrogenophaga sp. SL48 TaxID=2806347 RepID=UPI001F41F32E|nr:MobF family relaxase [Hydrogenophaga sp. SL48]UJW83055.1 relaxase domain-containing protein [Hydrogenophaga sp. SL48]
MLTLAKVVSAESAASYYEGSDDYYSEDGRAPSAWWGAGAEALGLRGEVDSDDFRTLLDGRLPDGQQMHRGGEGRTAGLDLTFSAPKSLSMQARIGGSTELLEAHRQAVTHALQYVQAELAAYRSTQDGETVSLPSRNVVAARFDHDLSRELDPQVHTHCVLLNLTQRPDGQWRALDAHALYEQQKLLGVLYRAELAMQVQELGYRIHRTHQDGRFELAHITREQVEAFSTRSRAIDAALAAKGESRATASAEMREIAGLSTRRAKDASIRRDCLSEAWSEKAAALGVNWKPDLQLAGAREGAEAGVRTRESVDFAVAHLTERSAIVSRLAIVQEALAHGTGSLGLDDVQADIECRLGGGELLASADGQRLTTPGAQAMEQELLGIERRGREVLATAIWEPQQGRLFDAPGAGETSAPSLGAHLTDGQRRGAELVLATRNRIVGVQGLAGTGKTAMLRTVSENLGENFKAIGLAPSAAAARELSAAGFEAMTIAGFIASGRRLDDRTVVVVDEAGMVSLRDMHVLLSAVDEAGARAVLVGDTGQLKAVEAGAPFRQLQEQGMATACMTDILRQQNEKLRGAVVDAAEGKVEESLKKLSATVAEVPHATERYERIARDYASRLPEERLQTLAVAGTNRARQAINERVRQRLGLAGTGVALTVLEGRDLTRAQVQSSLSYSPGDIVEALRHYDSIGLRRGDMAEVVETAPGCITLRREDGQTVQWRPTAMPHVTVHRAEQREVAVGDRIRFTANDYGLGVVNGQISTIEAIDLAAGELKVNVGPERSLTLDMNRPLQVDHAYCTTVHAAQGQTCDRVLVDADVRGAMANQSLYYVAISRARHSVTLYTDDKELLPRAMSRLDIKQAALDLHRPSSRGMSI